MRRSRVAASKWTQSKRVRAAAEAEGICAGRLLMMGLVACIMLLRVRVRVRERAMGRSTFSRRLSRPRVFYEV